MVDHWLCVTNEENWKVIKRQRIWGVSRKNEKQLKRTDIGDFLVFYVKPKRIAGIFRIVSKPFESEEEIFGSAKFPEKENFPNRVKLEPVIVPEGLRDFEELIPRLGFIARKEVWRTYLRKAMIWISRDSYDTLKRALEGA